MGKDHPIKSMLSRLFTSFCFFPYVSLPLRGLQFPLPGTCNPCFNVLWPVM